MKCLDCVRNYGIESKFQLNVGVHRVDATARTSTVPPKSRRVQLPRGLKLHIGEVELLQSAKMGKDPFEDRDWDVGPVARPEPGVVRGVAANDGTLPDVDVPRWRIFPSLLYVDRSPKQRLRVFPPIRTDERRYDEKGAHRRLPLPRRLARGSDERSRLAANGCWRTCCV